MLQSAEIIETACTLRIITFSHRVLIVFASNTHRTHRKASHTLHTSHNHCTIAQLLRRIDHIVRYSVLLVPVSGLKWRKVSISSKYHNECWDQLYRMSHASSSSKRLDDAPRYVCVCSKYNQSQTHMVSDTTWRR